MPQGLRVTEALRIASSLARLQSLPRARVAVLLGSGWGSLAERLQQATVWPYAELPAFPHLSVPGHAGRLLHGHLGGEPLWLLDGRQHAYETGDAGAMRAALRTLAALGVDTLVQTNAAGSLLPDMAPGRLMLISDHLNLAQRSPLVDDAEGGPAADRFVDLRDAYDPGLRALARQVAQAQGQTLHEGVYAWMLGPQFETPAEVRLLQWMGAQAVGMSTVPETILARHLGWRVLAVSLITNLACGLAPDAARLSHAQTLACAQAAGGAAVDWLCHLLAALPAAATQAALPGVTSTQCHQSCQK